MWIFLTYLLALPMEGWDTGNPLSATLAVPNVIDHVLFDMAAVLARVDHSGTQIAVMSEVQKYLLLRKKVKASHTQY